MKPGTVLAGLVLALGALVGCGGSDGDGGDASEEAPTTAEFCGALKDFQDDFSAADPTKDIDAYIVTLQAAAERLDDVGTPEDMPDDARDGFRITLDKISAIPDDATLDDLSSMTDLSDDETAKTEALDDYIAQTCPKLGGE